MKKSTVDVAIIGAGTAGLTARREVEKAGSSWLLIEGERYGTTCARVGCMPSKLLIAAAEMAHGAERGASFGVHVEGLRVDGRRVMERLRSLRDDFADVVVRDTEALPGERRPRGRARFTGPTTLRVGDDLEVEARAVVIAAGGTPAVPRVFDAVRDDVLTSDSAFELETLPESLAVIGAGLIGLELGQALSRLGARVAIFNRSDVVKAVTDPRIRQSATETLRAELDLRLGASVTAARRVPEGFELSWRDANGEHDEIFGDVLVATGRQPNLAALDLEATGLPLDERGMPPWNPNTTQCGDAAIFMAGDISGHRSVLHEAADEGRIAGKNSASFPIVTAHARRVPFSIIFTDPQMALVGRRFDELDGSSIAIGEVSWEKQGRARVMGVNRGLLRVYAEREDGSLVGAEIFGPRAEHLAHLLAWAIEQRMTVWRALEMPFYHPVFEEGLRTALRDAARELGRAK